MGTTFTWIFEDPRREEDVPYASMLERFRAVRDEIELRVRDWLEHPELPLGMLRKERERERRERLEGSRSGIGVSDGRDERPDPFARASGTGLTTESAVHAKFGESSFHALR